MSSQSERVADWGPSRRILAADVAERYYGRAQDKVRIAADLGLSRFQVAQLLKGARQRGIVRVVICPGDDVDPGLSVALRERYGLARALVTPGSGQVVTLAADLLTEVVRSGDVLGLAWSRTVNDVVGRLRRLPRCTVVQLCGAYSLPWRRDDSASAVFRAAALCGGEPVPIHAPLVLSDQRAARALRANPGGVSEAFAHFAALDTAVVSIGAWRPGHSTVHDVLTERQRRRLDERGACGEIVGMLIDRDGRVIDTELERHLIAVGEPELRTAAHVVGVVRDPERAEAACAVLRSGLIHSLVADAATAQAMLARSG